MRDPPPGDVYGPGSRPWTILPVEAIRSNRFVLPAMGNGIFSPLYVDNLSTRCCSPPSAPRRPARSSRSPTAPGSRCNEFFGRYSQMLGKPRARGLPKLAAMGLAALPEAAAAIGGTNTESNRAAMRYLARPGTYSIEKARRLLGYEPKVGLDEGMAARRNGCRDMVYFDEETRIR